MSPEAVAVLPASISFEMTDALAGRAARQHWRRLSRRLFTIGGLAITAASAALFVLALRRGASVWWLLLSGTGPALFAVAAIIWLTGFWWAPLTMRRKLARLPHRNVTVDFTPAGLVFQTAIERMETPWTALSAITELPDFWLFRLKTGADIPLPRASISAGLLAAIRAVIPPEPI